MSLLLKAPDSVLDLVAQALTLEDRQAFVALRNAAQLHCTWPNTLVLPALRLQARSGLDLQNPQACERALVRGLEGLN